MEQIGMVTTTDTTLRHRMMLVSGLLSALLLTACGGSAASTASACVDQYGANLDGLLAVDDFADLVGVEGAAITAETPRPGRLAYTWQGERQRVVGAGKVEFNVPLPSKIVLADLDSY